MAISKPFLCKLDRYNIDRDIWVAWIFLYPNTETKFGWEHRKGPSWTQERLERMEMLILNWTDRTTPSLTTKIESATSIARTSRIPEHINGINRNDDVVIQRLPTPWWLGTAYNNLGNYLTFPEMIGQDQPKKERLVTDTSKIMKLNFRHVLRGA